jgi:hypothetical protein
MGEAREIGVPQGGEFSPASAMCSRRLESSRQSTIAQRRLIAGEAPNGGVRQFELEEKGLGMLGHDAHRRWVEAVGIKN